MEMKEKNIFQSSTASKKNFFCIKNDRKMGKKEENKSRKI